MQNRRSLFLILVSVSALSLPLGTNAILIEPDQTEAKEVVRQIAIISTQDPVTILKKVKSELLGRTTVPLRWPTFIPAGADEEHPLYVNLLTASQTGYELELGWTDDCIGGNNCHYGTVRGGSAPLVENEGKRMPVKLDLGIQGYFIDFTCAAHCDDAAIGWAEGKYHYSISMMAEKKATLIKIVNSAIASGRS